MNLRLREIKTTLRTLRLASQEMWPTPLVLFWSKLQLGRPDTDEQI